MPLGQFDEHAFRYANYGDSNYTAGAYNQLGYSMNGNAQNVFTDWIFPQTREARQYAEQLEMYENSPSAQMQGMIKAGINPLTAAAGIAGSSSSIPSSSQSVNPFGDVASAVGAAAGVPASLGAAAKAFEEAEQVAPLAGSTIEKNDAEITKWSHDNGFSDAQASAFRIDNQTRSARNQADLNVKIQQFEVMKQDALKMEAEREYINKQIQRYDELIDATIDLKEKQSLEAEKTAFLQEERTRTEKMENDFTEKYHYRRENPFDVAMLGLWFQGEYDKVQSAQAFMYEHKYNLAYSESDATQAAIEEHAYSIANAQETAKSLNSIISDWNKPASGLWSLIDKGLGVTNGKKKVDNALSAKSNPSLYDGYAQTLVALQLSLDDINKQLEVASSQNDFSKIRELAKQRDGLQNFIENYSFEAFKSHCGHLY